MNKVWVYFSNPIIVNVPNECPKCKTVFAGEPFKTRASTYVIQCWNGNCKSCFELETEPVAAIKALRLRPWVD